MQAIIRKNSISTAKQLKFTQYGLYLKDHKVNQSNLQRSNLIRGIYSQNNKNSRNEQNSQSIQRLFLFGSVITLGLTYNRFSYSLAEEADQSTKQQETQLQPNQQIFLAHFQNLQVEENSVSQEANIQNNKSEVEQIKDLDDDQNQSVMKDITKENLKDILSNYDNKFIYFYRPSKQSAEDLQKVEEHATKMYNGLRVLPYRINLELYQDDLVKFLQDRNPSTADKTEEQVERNEFLLANQYDDIWFWEFDLIKYFYGDLLEQIFNFYQGPQKLMTEEQIIMSQSNDNVLHIIAYIDSYKNRESIKRVKSYRKFHTKNTDKFFHFKYWMTEDKELAKKLKIDTNLDNEGDIYLIRKSSIFNQKQKNINLCGYDYHSQKIMTQEDTVKDIQNSFAKIMQVAFNSPIQVHDYMTFASLQHKFKTNMFVVYCDKDQNPKQYDEILRTMIRARRLLPINLKPDENGQLQKAQRQQDVVFVLSSTKNLMPLTKICIDQPQALFITPEENFVDLLNNYLPKIEKIEGLSPEEFIRKALNNEEEFKYEEKDNDTERNKKDTLKLIYRPDRFFMGKMYQTADMIQLANAEKMVDFVKQSINGELKYYWDTDAIPKTKYSQKVVGEDFDKRILNSQKDALVLIYHPIEEKNRQLKNFYEEFVKNEESNHGLSKDGQLVYAKYNGINESQEFKSPQKLPQIVYFKRVANQDEKEIITLDNIEDLMVKTATKEQLQQRLKDFIKKNKQTRV